MLLGANIEVPLVYRASVGGGKGYGGQHSQTLESMFAHIPGLYVVYPATDKEALTDVKKMFLSIQWPVKR